MIRKKFKCPYCSFSAMHQCILKRHMRSHTGERPYPCEICGKKFTRREHMKRHTLVSAGRVCAPRAVCGHDVWAGGSQWKCRPPRTPDRVHSARRGEDSRAGRAAPVSTWPLPAPPWPPGRGWATWPLPRLLPALPTCWPPRQPGLGKLSSLCLEPPTLSHLCGPRPRPASGRETLSWCPLCPSWSSAPAGRCQVAGVEWMDLLGEEIVEKGRLGTGRQICQKRPEEGISGG